MSRDATIAVSPRDRAGKGAARAARRAGQVPGVVYGAKKTPEMIAIARGELMRHIRREGFMNTVFSIDLGGRTQKVLPRDLQFHPVTDEPLHVDFLRLTKGATIEIEVPVHFRGQEESVGIKRGGVLNIVRHEIELECDVDAIPEYLEVDISGLDINDSVHASSIALPEGAKLTITDRDFTVASVAPPTVAKTEEEEELEGEEEAVEGEEEDEGEED